MKCRFIIRLIVAVCVTSVLVSSGMTATPHKINYQGRATDISGNPVANGSHNVWFYLYRSSSGGSSLWSDNATIQTTDGLFSYILGSDPTAPLPDSLFTKNDSLFLAILLDGVLLTPRTALASVPYAMRVNSIDAALGGNIYGDAYFRNPSDSTRYFVAKKAAAGNAGAIELRRNGGLNTSFLVDADMMGEGSSYAFWAGHSQVVFDMRVTGNNSIQLPLNAIKSTEIANEAGVGSYINQTGYTLTSPGVTAYLGSRAMFAPSAGYVLVIATAEVYISHFSGDWEVVQLGISDNCTSLYESTRTAVQLTSGLPTGQYSFPVTVHGLFPVDSGTTTFCFMGELITTSSITIENISISELFVPTAYTTVIQPSAAAPPLDPEEERASELSFHEARLQAELDLMKAEVAAMKDALRNVQEISGQE